MSSLMRGVRPAGRYRMPVSSAFTKARQRLGPAPLRWLFEQTRGPIACPATPGAFALGLRLVSWDGALFEVADTPAHHQQFPAGTGVGNPQIRVLTLTECATHAVIDAVFGGAGNHSEQALAATLSRALTPGMLFWQTGCSPATSCGPWLMPPARSCCGGSSARTSTTRSPTCPTVPSWPSWPPPATPSGTAKPGSTAGPSAHPRRVS